MDLIYRYSWGPRFVVKGLPVLERKGELCRVIVRGAMNSALVEFDDGTRHVISRNALRRYNLTKPPSPSMFTGPGGA